MDVNQKLDKRNTCHDTVVIEGNGAVTPACHLWKKEDWPHGSCQCGKYSMKELPSGRFAMIRTVIRGV